MRCMIGNTPHLFTRIPTGGNNCLTHLLPLRDLCSITSIDMFWIGTSSPSPPRLNFFPGLNNDSLFVFYFIRR